MGISPGPESPMAGLLGGGLEGELDGAGLAPGAAPAPGSMAQKRQDHVR